ncbi:MAG: 4Fe-4S dicluster domain-containing protein, partial [Gammaproteobacteria bacterium]
MAEIKPKRKGSALRPLKTLSFLGKEAVTLPLEPRPAAERYRGFHLNDWTKCIGCGTCASICDNLAIHMVHIPGLPEDPLKGVKPRRPAIDYGRCCWCALCVDICPTGSIALSREYIHI